MKELETHLRELNKTDISIKKKQEKEYFLKGNIKPMKGHFVWEINEETGEIKKAKYHKRTVISFNKMTKKEPDKLIINPDCVYIPALNSENAKLKYLKNKDQAHYYSKPPILDLTELKF